MSIYFIDYLCFLLDKEKVYEICIIESNNVFNPIYFSGTTICEQCLFSSINYNKIFYCKQKKLELLSKMYPLLRLVGYTGHVKKVPNNISCVWNIHDKCAYKTCLSLCIDYLSDV